MEKENQKQRYTNILIYRNMPGIRVDVLNREVQRQVEKSV
jgi:hypothetical protein